MGVTVKNVEESKAALRAYAAAAASEDLGRRVLRAAMFPVMQAIKRNLRPHRVTGLTELDIALVDQPDSEPGVVRVAAGGTGNKGGRGYIMTFLENGTVFMRARPIIRPAADAEAQPQQLMRRVAEQYKLRLGLKQRQTIF